MRRLGLLCALPLVVGACEGSKEAGNTPGTPDFGHCTYVNKFSKGEECREYEGSGWTEATVKEDCAGQNGELSAGGCAFDDTLGTCVLTESADKKTRVVMAGSDPGQCSGQKLGCETFAGGTFVPDAPCEGDPVGSPGSKVFQPAELVCKAPVEGEPPGMSAGGEVCTWAMISGCTEPGRKFAEYASCEPVYTQRPHYAVPPPKGAADPDPRMNDPQYKAEVDWVREQVESCACVCCHQESLTPEGAGVWDIEGEGNWINTFTPYGLAFAGGFIPSWPLGAYPKDENNGFDRETTGIPTTDPARMAAFFAAELEHRGKSVQDYAGSDPTPAIFYEQHTFEPGACEGDSGVAADGTVRWSGGGARYVYVLSAGASNPGLPPNLDLPQGTVWRLDVRPDEAPVYSGQVVFGTAPERAKQAYPASDAPVPLAAGETYHLHVLADVGAPITRCLFTFGG